MRERLWEAKACKSLLDGRQRKVLGSCGLEVGGNGRTFSTEQVKKDEESNGGYSVRKFRSSGKICGLPFPGKFSVNLIRI